MKKLLLVLSCLLIMISTTYAKEIKIICDNWEPYQYDKEGKTIGVSAEIVKEVFTKMGYIVPDKIETYPWARAELLVVNGEADVLFTKVYSEDKATKIKYSTEPLLESNWYLYVHKDKIANNRFNSMDDLNGKPIGGVRGYTYPKTFTDYVEKNAILQLVNSDDLNIRKLIVGGRVDYIIMDELNAIALLKRLSAEDQIIRLTKTVEPVKMYVVFSKKVPNDVIDLFDKILKDFKTTQEYKNILSNYK